MASFRFNFQEEDDEGIKGKSSNDNRTLQSSAKEISIAENVVVLTDRVKEIAVNRELILKYIHVGHVEQQVRHELMNLDSCNTDLVPDVYEGGLKIWECTMDLVKFLEESGVKFKDKRVFEVGCGAGLPGILALLKGASVDFQDYNDEVIELFTIPNVFLNLRTVHPNWSANQIKDRLTQSCHFYAGDWKCLQDFINPLKDPDQLYDFILTSETIYNASNHCKLLDLIRSHLRYPDGEVYVAAKTYYFGVGGGTRTFENLVKKSQDLSISLSMKYVEGVQREILTMKWKHR